MNISKIFKKIVGDFDNENTYDENQDSRYNSGYNNQTNGNNPKYKKDDIYSQDIDGVEFEDFDDSEQYENNISSEIFQNTKLDIKIELYEDSSSIYIKALVFGVKEEDIFIDISRDTVVLSGKRESQHIVEDEAYFAQELEWGSFYREIKLPKEIDIDSSTAELDLGILFIKMKKTDKYRKRKLVANN